MRDLEFDIRARDRTAAGFDSARNRARDFNGDLDRTARGFNVAGTAAKAFAAAFTITAISDFGRIVRQVLTDAADLVDLADKVGVSTEHVQRMAYGFGLAGVAASDIDGILTQWSKRIGEAHTAGGKLLELFKANGLSLTDSEGRLRSSVDLMRDYADLIANASSDQERMKLATDAFGRSGDAMVLALRDGAAGMDRLMQKADEAGGVLEDELLRRAADIDDEFNDMWRNFEIYAKSAILNTVTFLDDLRGYFRDLQEQHKKFSTLAPQLVPSPAGHARTTPKDDRDLASSRIADAFGGPAPADNPELARLLRDRFAKRTVIPDDDKSRSGSARAAREQESAYERVIAKLREERELIGLNATDQRILTEQRRAGVSATSAQGQAIAGAIRTIDGERAALKRLEDQQAAVNDMMRTAQDIGMQMASTVASGIERLIDGTATLNDVVGDLTSQLGSMLLNKGLEMLLNVLTSGIGGGFGGGFKPTTGGFAAMLGIAGFRAAGGPVDPWKTYVVGERGPELLRMGGQGGHVTANGDVGGGASGAISITYAPQIDARGASADAFSRLEAIVAQDRQQFTARVANAVLDARRRGALQ